MSGSGKQELDQARAYLRKEILTNATLMGEGDCPDCFGLGFVYDPSASRGDIGDFDVCTCMKPKCRCGGEFPYEYYDEEQRTVFPCPTRKVRLWLDKLRALEKKSGIPYRFQRKFIESIDFEPGKASGMFFALDHARFAIMDFPFRDRRRGLYIHGNTGSGKTLLSCVILNEIMSLYLAPVKYAKITRDVLGKLRSSFNPNSESYGEGRKIEEELGTVPALVMDDFGAHKQTEWVNSVLYDLIDARYENNLLTIVTSNDPLESWKGISQNRLHSRLKSMCAEIQLKEPDFREQETTGR